MGRGHPVDLHRDALLAAGVPPQHLYEDCAPGRRDDHPSLATCLKALRQGDVLVVWKLDRLSRSLKDVLILMEKVEKAEAGFLSLTESIDTCSDLQTKTFRPAINAFSGQH